MYVQGPFYCKTTDEHIRDSKIARLMPREILAGIIYFLYFLQEKAYTNNETQLVLPSVIGTVHFYDVGGGWWDLGGSPKKKMALKGGHLKKIREKGGSRKIF